MKPKAKKSNSPAKKKSKSPAKKSGGNHNILSMFKRQSTLQQQVKSPAQIPNATSVTDQEQSSSKKEPVVDLTADAPKDKEKESNPSQNSATSKRHTDGKKRKLSTKSESSNQKRTKDGASTSGFVADSETSDTNNAKLKNKPKHRLSLKYKATKDKQIECRKETERIEREDPIKHKDSNSVLDKSEILIDDLNSSQKENAKNETRRNIGEGSSDNRTKKEQRKSIEEDASETVDDASDNVIVHEDGTIEYKVPYYLENFLLIINSVTKDEFFSDLFNDEDLQMVKKFLALTDNAQKLYVRLFGRNHRWIRSNKISYPRIADDLNPELQELVAANLLLDEDHLEDLSITLHALPAPDVRSLAKTLHILPNQTREQLIEAIQKHTQKSSIGSFFAGGSSKGTSKIVLKRAKSMLGAAYCVAKKSRSVFLRCIMLFALHRTHTEDDDSLVQQQLFQILQSNIGSVKYPSYTVNRATRIFSDRDAFLQFSEALQLEQDIAEALEKKEFDAAQAVYDKAKEVVGEICQQSNSHALQLPIFLRRYTAGAAYTRILSYGVELLQYTKQYSAAVQQLEELVAQDVYHTEYRGRWYERWALNLDYHLKQTNKALDVISQALADPCVKVGHRLALFQRAQKICQTTAHNKFIRARWKEFESDSMAGVKEAPKVTIEAVQLATSDPSMHASYVWLIPGEEGEGEVIMKRVEDVALKHYRDLGYCQGLHGEGGTFTFLFCLLFWDIIFLEGLPDVFYHEYQTQPLDLSTEQFYLSRAEQIEQRLREIEQGDVEDLCTRLAATWVEHEGTLCSGVSWERFESVEHLQGLVHCLGPRAIGGICGRMGRNWRFCTSGVPDLVVWNPDTLKVKIVEVKGPGDRLSTKQILWLDYLQQLGLEAEVCHVQGISSKKLRK